LFGFLFSAGFSLRWFSCVSNNTDSRIPIVIKKMDEQLYAFAGRFHHQPGKLCVYLLATRR